MLTEGAETSMEKAGKKTVLLTPPCPTSLLSPVRMVNSKREVGVHILLASWEL